MGREFLPLPIVFLVRMFVNLNEAVKGVPVWVCTKKYRHIGPFYIFTDTQWHISTVAYGNLLQLI